MGGSARLGGLAAQLEALEGGIGDGGEDADDRHDDHQLDQREATTHPHPDRFGRPPRRTRAKRSLASAEVRLAPLAEGALRLARIFARTQRSPQLFLAAIGLGERQAEQLAHAGARRLHGERRVRGDRIGRGEGPRQQLVPRAPGR